jgi:hypothetical protein
MMNEAETKAELIEYKKKKEAIFNLTNNRKNDESNY